MFKIKNKKSRKNKTGSRLKNRKLFPLYGAVIFVLAFGVVGVNSLGTSSAAIYDQGLTDNNSPTYTDPNTKVKYYISVRTKLRQDTTPSPDKWQYVTQVDCMKISTSGVRSHTACNIDVFGGYIYQCNQESSNSCGLSDGGIKIAGPGNWECNYNGSCADGQAVFSGAWHSEIPNAINNHYIEARTMHIRARFSKSSTNHLTNVYRTCSLAVDLSNDVGDSGNSCSIRLVPV